MQRLLRFERVCRPLATLCAVGGLAAALYAERDGIAAYPWRLSWPAFVGATLLFACGPVAGAASFHILLRDLSGYTPLGACARIWMRGFLARYVPSGALTMAVRVRARGQLQATAGQVWRASLVEQVVSAIAGAGAATVAFALAREHVPPAAPLLLGAAVVVALAVMSRRAVAVAALVSFCAWLATGVAAWLIVVAMAPAAPGVFAITGAYAFAWLIGFVVVFAPGGLGIREATLIALLGPSLGTAPATLVAVALRLASTTGDILAFCGVEVAAALWRVSSSGPGLARSADQVCPVVPRDART